MTITLENVMTYLSIIGVAVGGVRYLIIAPLNTSITQLAMAIERLESKLNLLTEKMDEYRERLAIVETSAKQAHKRIDRIEDVLDADEK